MAEGKEKTDNSQKPEPVFIGIDFGTCNLKASYYRPGKKNPLRDIKLNKNQFQGSGTPNVIYYKRKQDGSIEHLVGEIAQKEDDAANTVAHVKRTLVKPGWHKYIANLERDVEAPEVIEDIFELIYKTVQDQRLATGKIPATVTVPVLFSPLQRSIIENAAMKAGFDVRHVVAESFAGLFSQQQLFTAEKRDEVILIFDFGGATLDISLVELHNAGTDDITVRELSSIGLQLGGIDIDEIILRDILDKKYPQELAAYRQSHATADSAEAELLAVACRIKENLFGEDTEETSDYLTDKQGHSFEIQVTQDEVIRAFDANHLREKVERVLDDLFLGQDELSRKDVTLVLPFGGSSRIMYFLQILSDYMGTNDDDEPIFDLDDFDPDDNENIYLAISEGAAAYTYFLASRQDIEIDQMIPFRVGIARKGHFLQLLPKGDPALSISIKQNLDLDEISQHGNRIAIYQTFSNVGEGLDIRSEDVVYIGYFEIHSDEYDHDAGTTFQLRYGNHGELLMDTQQWYPDEDDPSEVETLPLINEQNEGRMDK